MCVCLTTGKETDRDGGKRERECGCVDVDVCAMIGKEMVERV